MGEENNVLSGGIEALQEMKAQLLKKGELSSRVAELKTAQQSREKSILAKQKAMDSELTSTITKRQAEVERTYDDQVAKTRDQIKQVRAKREKTKGTRVNERVGNETADLHERIRELKQDLKGVFTRQHISRIFNNEYFFSLFMPDGPGDFLIILVTILIILGIPGIVFLILPDAAQKIWILIAMYVVILAIAFGVFTLIYKNVRNKHLEGFAEARSIRRQISAVRKNISSKEKTIRKDKDESSYGLEEFDREMAGLDSQIECIVNEKKQALTDFENRTKKDITDEIKARYMPEIGQLKADNEAAYNEERACETEMKALELEISNRYEAYLGKDNMTVPMLDNLIEIISSGEATDISGALARYKELQAEPKKDTKKEV